MDRMGKHKYYGYSSSSSDSDYRKHHYNPLYPHGHVRNHHGVQLYGQQPMIVGQPHHHGVQVTGQQPVVLLQPQPVVLS